MTDTRGSVGSSTEYIGTRKDDSSNAKASSSSNVDWWKEIGENSFELMDSDDDDNDNFNGVYLAVWKDDN